MEKRTFKAHGSSKFSEEFKQLQLGTNIRKSKANKLEKSGAKTERGTWRNTNN